VEPSLLIGSGKAEEIQMVKSFMQQPWFLITNSAECKLEIYKII
jgi:hypothetical protein